MPKLDSKALSKAQRRLIDKSEPVVEKAFHESHDDLRDGIDMSELVRAIDRGDVNGALAAMNIDPAAFLPLRKAVVDVYDEAGKQVIDAMPPLEKPGG